MRRRSSETTRELRRLRHRRTKLLGIVRQPELAARHKLLLDRDWVIKTAKSELVICETRISLLVERVSAEKKMRKKSCQRSTPTPR